MPLNIAALIEMIRRSVLEIPELPSNYNKRVFVGGNYNDMFTLRKIVGYVKKTGFTPILAFDIKDVPKEKIYYFDTTLVKLCKYAVFEVSTGNGHMMEINSAVTLGAVVLTFYKIRSARHRNPSPDVSSMLTTLGVPMLAYHDDDRLRAIIDMIFPGIRDDPRSTWVNIVQAAHSPSWNKSWFASTIDYILQHV